MIAVRMAAFSGLACSLAVAIWAGGTMLLIQPAEPFDARFTLGGGLKGLWAAQSLAIAVVAPWLMLHFGWYRAAMGQLIFILLPFPLLALCWLVGAAKIMVLVSGALALLVWSLLIVCAAAMAVRQLSAPLLRNVAITTVQVVSVSGSLILLEPWFDRMGL